MDKIQQFLKKLVLPCSSIDNPNERLRKERDPENDTLQKIDSTRSSSSALSTLVQDLPPHLFSILPRNIEEPSDLEIGLVMSPAIMPQEFDHEREFVDEIELADPACLLESLPRGPTPSDPPQFNEKTRKPYAGAVLPTFETEPLNMPRSKKILDKLLTVKYLFPALIYVNLVKYREFTIYFPRIQYLSIIIM
jgi:hypothetical protein